MVRELLPSEIGESLDLAWRVFSDFEAPDYSPEGVEEFRRSIHDPIFIERLRFFGAWKMDRLVGMLATRNNGSHIAQFFVDKAFHRQGIGRALFTFADQLNPCDRMTVNASPYAVPVYQHLGFTATMPEQVTNGLRYTPMIRLATRSASLCPCGADCTVCEKYPGQCAGCASIQGKVWWTAYTGQEVCPFYACCVEEHHLLHCGKCAQCPCDQFQQGDPTKTDTENSELFRSQMERLSVVSHAPPSS